MHTYAIEERGWPFVKSMCDAEPGLASQAKPFSKYSAADFTGRGRLPDCLRLYHARH